MKFKIQKIIAIMLALMLAFAMVACGRNASSDDDWGERDVAVDIDDSDDDVDDDEGDDDGFGVGSEPVTPKGEAAVEEKVLFDQDGIIIKAVSLTKDTYTGYNLNLYIENNTEMNLTFGVEYLSVNNAMVSGHLYAQVAAGKKANDSISIYEDELDKSGIALIKEFQFRIEVRDSDSYKNVLMTDYLTVTTTADASYEQEFDTSGKVLYNDNGLKIVMQGTSTGRYGDALVHLYIENNTGTDIVLSSDDESLNGFMVRGIFYSYISNGKVAFDEISFSESELQKNGITELVEMEVTFTVRPWDNYRQLFEIGTIKVTF